MWHSLFIPSMHDIRQYLSVTWSSPLSLLQRVACSSHYSTWPAVAVRVVHTPPPLQGAVHGFPVPAPAHAAPLLYNWHPALCWCNVGALLGLLVYCWYSNTCDSQKPTHTHTHHPHPHLYSTQPVCNYKHCTPLHCPIQCILHHCLTVSIL